MSDTGSSLLRLLFARNLVGSAYVSEAKNVEAFEELERGGESDGQREVQTGNEE